jgi:cobalt-zinc-cadmium efflux system membrane fusion protein
MRDTDPRASWGRALACAGLITLGAASSAWAGGPAAITRGSTSQLNRVELTPEAVKRLELTVGPVTRVPVPRALKVGGVVLPRPGTSALLRAPMSGTVEAPPGSVGLPVPGAVVRAGQTVLRLRPLVAPNLNLLAETERDQEQARARKDTAEKATARARRLLKEGAGDQAAVEQAEQDLAVADAELRAAQERLQRAKRDPLGADVSLPLRAPRDGVVLTLVAAEGQTVEQGAPLVEVVSTEDLWVRVPLYVGRIARVDRSRPAEVRALGGAGPAYPALPVRSIPVPSPDGTVADVFYTLPAQANLQPGARVLVQLTELGSEAPALVVPASALFRDAQGAAWVYAAVEETVFERRMVDVATVVGDQVVLARGPAEGTKIVLVGAMELYGTEFGNWK